jgi:Fe-S-cluster containining protein
MSTKKPDCRRCGACCIALLDQSALADVSEADFKRLSPRWADTNVLFPHPFDLALAAIGGGCRLPLGAIKTKKLLQRRGPLKGLKVCACTALRGSVLHRTSCSIYERRPESCRTAVEPGDETCLSLRRYWAKQVEAA